MEELRGLIRNCIETDYNPMEELRCQAEHFLGDGGLLIKNPHTYVMETLCRPMHSLLASSKVSVITVACRWIKSPIHWMHLAYGYQHLLRFSMEKGLLCQKGLKL